MAEAQELKKYRGNCHCGDYVFEVQLPEIKSAHQCNCSVCSKKGALWQFPKEDQIKWVKGDPKTLTSYTFGNKTFTHTFCPTCGSAFSCVGYIPKPEKEPEMEYCINVRLLQGVSVWDLDIEIFDGASFPPAYQPPKFTGPEPVAQIEGARTYTGSCHCGAVTLAFKTLPLDETYPEPMVDCNCSICNRNGYIWVYPKRDQSSFVGRENLNFYEFGLKLRQKTFCKICGVPINNQTKDLPEEDLAKLPEEHRLRVTARKDYMPINVRILDGVDFKSLKPAKINNWEAADRPKYVNP